MSVCLLIICFHGTNAKSANNILKTGFKPWTYFADHLEDALKFGGNHVFEVCFKKDGLRSRGNNDWQFMNRKTIRPNKIVRYFVIKRTTKMENKKLEKEVFESKLQSKTEVIFGYKTD